MTILAGILGAGSGGAGSDTTAIHDNVTGEIAAVTEKTSVVAADLVLIEDSAASNAKKRATIANAVDARAVEVTGSKMYYTDNVADDAVWSQDLGANIFAGGMFVIGSNSANRGLFTFRTPATTFCIAVSATGITATTGALTGTTGADGTVTVSVHTDNKVYVENRTGGTRHFTLLITTPFWP